VRTETSGHPGNYSAKRVSPVKTRFTEPTSAVGQDEAYRAGNTIRAWAAERSEGVAHGAGDGRLTGVLDVTVTLLARLR
jgi:hypothetical protein